MFAVCFPREVILCPELCGDLSALRWRRQMMMSVCSIPRFVEARAPKHTLRFHIILYYIIPVSLTYYLYNNTEERTVNTRGH